MSPNQPKTPARTVRIDDRLWSAARDLATREGVSVSDVIRTALEQYVNQWNRPPPADV